MSASEERMASAETHLECKPPARGGKDANRVVQHDVVVFADPAGGCCPGGGDQSHITRVDAVRAEEQEWSNSNTSAPLPC